MSFSTSYEEVLNQLDEFDPIKYAFSRNYLDGQVSRLSPYISRGVISTRFVLEFYLSKGYQLKEIKKFAQELAWRDYWQNIWSNHGVRIDSDFRSPQNQVAHMEMLTSLASAQTGINAIDQGLMDLIETGYMHNHMRMYVAAMATNIGKAHWKSPAQWMYYHLLDGDWASNNLSWQWVAGTNSNKKYIANQENINKYCRSSQTDTYLDVSYEELAEISIPDELKDNHELELNTNLPETKNPKLDPDLPTSVYNYYNLDPNWMKGRKVNRIFLLEPSVFAKYPISDKALQFALELSKNIENIQVFVGEFSDLESLTINKQIHYKEHPLNSDYRGTKHKRDWIYRSELDYSSFFKFWKQSEKEISLWQMN